MSGVLFVSVALGQALANCGMKAAWQKLLVVHIHTSTFLLLQLLCRPQKSSYKYTGRFTSDHELVCP